MTERHIDSDRYAADEQLDSAHLTYVADMGLEAQKDATRGCVATWDYRYPPRLHSIPAGSDGNADPASEMGFMIFLWRPALYADELVMRVRATGVVGTTTLHLALAPLGELVRGTIPASRASVSCATGERTVILTASDLSLNPDTVYAVLLMAESTLSSTAEVWYDHNTGSPGTALVGWRRAGYYGERNGSGGASNTYWGTSSPTYTANAHNIEPYLIEWVTGSSPHTDTWDDSKVGPTFPVGRLGRRISDSDVALTGTSYDVVYVWPPIEEDTANLLALTATDWIRRTPLSYVSLHSVEIVETTAALAGIGTSVAPEQPASALAARGVNRFAEHVITHHAPCYAIAPTPDYSDAANPSSLGFSRHAGVEVQLTASYQTLIAEYVGDPHRYSIGSTDYAQATYRVTMLLSLLVLRAEDGDTGDLLFEATITEADGSTTSSTTVTYTHPAAPVTAIPSTGAPRVSAGYWLGGYAPDVADRTPPLMSTSGTWCRRAWATARPIVVELDVPDDTSNAAGRERLLTVKVKRDDTATYPVSDAFVILDGLEISPVGGIRPEMGSAI